MLQGSKMNDNIKKLFDIAGTDTSGKWMSIYNAEHFAELIIKECANRIDYWESKQGEHCDDILKHFGVSK